MKTSIAPNMQNHCNSTMKLLLLCSLLALSALSTSASLDYEIDNTTVQKIPPAFLRNRQLSTISTEQVPCSSLTNNKCECPGTCMSPNNTTSPVCKLIKCYGWDTNLNKCIETGPAFTPAMVLQAIPFTGIFGSGFGNMGRWDIFGIYMAVVFGPTVLLIIACCCIMMGNCAQNEDRLDCWQCFISCFGCIWGVAILALWIWGIVVIANKEILGPHSCPLN